MRDATPTGDGASTEPKSDPSAGSAAVLAASSSNTKTDLSAAKAEAFRLLSDTPEAQAAHAGATDEPASTDAGASDGATQGSIFGFRNAFKSAVRVLTKERSFTRDDSGFTPTQSQPEPSPATQPAAEAEPEAEMERRPAGLSGHTSAVAIPEVLGFLAQLRKSGTLWIWNEREQFRIQLVGGNVTFARDETPQRGWLLGEVLVSQGAIDAARFDEFMKQPREPGPLGDALLRAGLVDQQALSGAVQFQAQRVFNRAYGLENAHFLFDVNQGNDAKPSIQISVTHMLFESARARDESEQRLSSVFDDPFGVK